jgi:hypothetical protein
LKKSIFPNVQNFPEALVRSSENYMGGHMSSPISNSDNWDHTQSTALRAYGATLQQSGWGGGRKAGSGLF